MIFLPPPPVSPRREGVCRPFSADSQSHRISSWLADCRAARTCGSGSWAARGRSTQLLEADGRLDVVPEDRLSGLHVAAQHRVDAFTQKRLCEFLVALDVALHQFLEALCSGHFTYPFGVV